MYIYTFWRSHSIGIISLNFEFSWSWVRFPALSLIRLCHFLHFTYLFIYLFIYLLIYLLAVLGLRFCARAFSSCGKRGHSSSRCAGLSLSRPLLLRSTGSRRAGSVVVAHGPSCSVACGIFPDQSSNPCPLHWQADSQPLRHQGSPILLNFKCLCLYFKNGNSTSHLKYLLQTLLVRIKWDNSR